MNKKELAAEKETVSEMSACVKLSDKDKQELLRLKCRTNFLTFAKYITHEVPIAGKFMPYKVHGVIANYLQAIGDGDATYKQTAISLPPRTGKSLLISKIFPAWQLGRSPTAQFIMSSYGLQLVNESARAVIEYVGHKQFSWLFPECTIDVDQCNLTTIRSKEGGLIKTASAMGRVTGFGYGVIDEEDLPGVGILDDLLADGNSPVVMESTFAWTTTQFLTRGLPNHSVISMGTRFHAADVIGQLLAADPDGWRELNVPALCVNEETDVLGRKLGESHWPEFFPVEKLEAIKRSVAATVFNALYQGKPQGEAGAIFKHHWFKVHEQNLEKYNHIYATVDTAYKAKTSNDFTAICIFGYNKPDNELHLIHYILERLEFPELEKLLCDLIKTWKIRAVYIEGRAAGMPLIQTMQRTTKIPIKELVPNKDKVLRANSVAPLLEAGALSIYENIPDYNARLGELTAFPFIKNDDFVDGVIYGLEVFRDEFAGSGPIIGGSGQAKRAALPSIVHSSDVHDRGGGSRLLSARRTSLAIATSVNNRECCAEATKFL